MTCCLILFNIVYEIIEGNGKKFPELLVICREPFGGLISELLWDLLQDFVEAGLNGCFLFEYHRE